MDPICIAILSVSFVAGILGIAIVRGAAQGDTE